MDNGRLFPSLYLNNNDHYKIDSSNNNYRCHRVISVMIGYTLDTTACLVTAGEVYSSWAPIHTLEFSCASVLF